MNRQDYRAAFDALPFDESFREKTIQTLRRQAGQPTERKYVSMKKRRYAIVAAALSALLVVSAAAAVMLLRPQEVAQHLGNEALSAAFESDKAVTINEKKTVDGFDVTFMGLVSGEGLEGLEDGVTRDKTYAVLSMARTDGEAITEDVPELTVSPLVEGYAPWQLNAWTLGGGVGSFAADGVLYYLFECDSVEPFADHTVYLAVYPGTHIPPDAETFGFDQDTGAITAQDGKDVALFILPLDASKANAEKAAELAGDFVAPVSEGDPEFGTRLHPAEESGKVSIYGITGTEN